LSETRRFIRRIIEYRNLGVEPTTIIAKGKMTAPKVYPIPIGSHSISPNLCVKGAAQAMEFYKQAFGAQELCRVPAPDGTLMCGAFKIGDSILFLYDQRPSFGVLGPNAIGETPVRISLYVEDVHALFNQAVKAGAIVRTPLEDQPWGDCYGVVRDPFGHSWGLAAHKQVSREAKRPKASSAKGAETKRNKRSQRAQGPFGSRLNPNIS
jgi:PhnB protein